MSIPFHRSTSVAASGLPQPRRRGAGRSLLALTPQLSGDGTRFAFTEFAGNARKTSGSYYTPDALVQCLLDSALEPMVEAVLRGKFDDDAEQAILDLKVCDPAVGSGHFLVGAAHRLARVRVHAAGESEPSPLLYQHALRDIIGRCLYGVDMNPMADDHPNIGQCTQRPLDAPADLVPRKTAKTCAERRYCYRVETETTNLRNECAEPRVDVFQL